MSTKKYTKNIQKLDTIGDRLRYLRSILHISRGKISELFGIPEASIRSWELGITNISYNSAIKLVDAYKSAGVDCSLNWILHGEVDKTAIIDIQNNDLLHIEKEKKIFLSNEKKIIFKTKDSCCEPFIPKNTLIGGEIINQDLWPNLVGKLCLIKLENDLDFILRNISHITKNNEVSFNCININSPIEDKPFSKDEKISQLAILKWIRFI